MSRSKQSNPIPIPILTEEDIQKEKYRRIYNEVTRLQLDEFLDINAACKKLGISYNLFNTAKKFVYKENGIETDKKQRTKKAPVKKVVEDDYDSEDELDYPTPKKEPVKRNSEYIETRSLSGVHKKYPVGNNSMF